MPDRKRRTRHVVQGGELLEARRVLSGSPDPGEWTIQVADVNAAVADEIIVDRDPVDASRIRATVNGVVVDSRPEAAVRLIRVFSGRGGDTIAVDLPGNFGIGTLIDSGHGADTVTGSDGSDTILAGPGGDTISGGRGRDSIWGGPGEDSISGGAGGDTVSGGSGNDAISGDDGSDTLDGNGGRDTLRAGRGRNSLVGGAGHDTFFGIAGVDSARLEAGEQLIGNESTNPLRAITDVETLRSWYIDAAMKQWGSMLGGPAFYPTWRGGDALVATPVNTTSPAGNHSETNTQVAGVDEGDIVETDGQHLFVLAGDGVDILSTAPGDDLAALSHVTIAGEEEAILLHGTRLTVISRYDEMPEMPAGRFAYWGYGVSQRTAVTVVDVSDVTAPLVVERTEIDGWFVTSRAIGGRVIVVTQDGLDIPAPAFIPGPGTPPPTWPNPVIDDVVSMPIALDAEPAADPLPAVMVGSLRPWWPSGVYEGEAAYRARLDAAWEAGVLPRFSVDGVDVGTLATDGRIYLPVDPDSTELLTVATFEVGDDVAGPESLSTVAGVSGIVSASTSSLYVASTAWGNWWDPADERATTNVYKFDLGDASVPLVAMGAVPGQVLDQFSLDEHDGLLRVATTRWTAGDAGSSSGVYVLRQADGNLSLVGAVDRLAPGERIYSARFVGDRAYVSTFRQIDPFFVIDLAEPSAPRVEGELKVPGFSNFLQPLDETHVLGIGRDADPETGRPLGVQVSLFDVGDPSAPVREAVYTFSGGSWDSWSEALWDHHAVSWFPEQGILTLPLQQYDDVDGSSNTLVVLHVDRGATAGFTVVGEITHDQGVRRSVRVGEFLYSVSWGEVQMHSLADPTAVIARRRIQQAWTAPIVVW